MKTAPLALCLLIAAGCGSKSEDAKPAPAPTASVTYTNGAGQSVPVSSYQVFSTTAPPIRINQARRNIVVRAVLITGYEVNITYCYMGATFPGTIGPVALNEAITADYSSNSQPVSQYLAPLNMGTLRVESVSPQVVSGSYSGPLTAGGNTVNLVFSQLPI